MANFTTKILGLAGPALVFAGVAFGQATCAAPTSQTNIIRAEGTTEQVAQLTFVCTVAAGATTPAVGGTATAQVFLSPALPVTSKVLNTSTGATEASITVNGGPVVAGTVSGSTINFSGIVLPAAPTLTFVVSNVRVNATSLSVGSGVPPAISETVFVSGSAANINPAALTATQVAFAQNGLGTSSLRTGFTFAPVSATSTGFPNGTIGSTSGANNFVICNAYSPKIDGAAIFPSGVAGKSLAFVVRIPENTATAFKNIAHESSQVLTATSNAVVNGTRFQVNFSNVPANVTLYVPNGILTSANGSVATAQLTSSAGGTALATVSGSTSTSITTNTGLTSGGANSLAAVTVSAGSGSAVFEIVLDDPNNLDLFYVPVFIVTTSNTVSGSSTPISATVNLSPTGSTTIPNFAVGASTTTLTASTFNLCSTSLLFPFVTNQLGFDTGIAISNTSTDPFGSNGATAQAGTCTLNFYGSGAPSPANVTTPNVPSGTVYAQVLSGIGAGFQGYIIAQCSFQYAHGFAFITDGVGVNGGLSQGYLAGVIPDVNQKSRGADPLSAAGAGSGETLGN
jgi:hypothetical protein